MGRHFPPNVPAVTNLEISLDGGLNIYHVTWTVPDHNPDGSVFDDLAGHMFYFLKVTRTTQILRQQYLEPTEFFSFTEYEIPEQCNTIGVINYDVMGSASTMVKAPIP